MDSYRFTLSGMGNHTHLPTTDGKPVAQSVKKEGHTISTFHPKARIHLIEAGILTCVGFCSFPSACGRQWIYAKAVYKHLQLRVQFQIFTEFPFNSEKLQKPKSAAKVVRFY